jgi:hypothetical protein
MSNKTPDTYELAALATITRWRDAKPDWGTRVMSRPGQAAAMAAQKMVPVSALRAALQGLERAAGYVAGRKDVLKVAGVESVAEIAALPLPQCDALARRVTRRGQVLGGAGGAVFGVAGAAGMVADIPALLTLALRTIHRTAYCYGEDWLLPQHRSKVIGVFALASANSLEEKQSAWEALQHGNELLDSAWRDGVERVAERELAKEATQFSLTTLASRIGANLGQRKAFGVVPVLGAVIGSAINAGYIHDIGKVARYVMQDQWLQRRYPALDRAAITADGQPPRARKIARKRHKVIAAKAAPAD